MALAPSASLASSKLMPQVEQNNNIHKEGINPEDIDNVIICMKIADNIHDFCKARGNVEFNKIEKYLNTEKFIIKNSPSTIEETTPKQLTINTGLYTKDSTKRKHTPIAYSNIQTRLLVSNLIHREDNVGFIPLTDENTNKLDAYLEFIKDVTDLNLKIPVKRNLDGKRIFSIDQCYMCKNILMYLHNQ